MPLLTAALAATRGNQIRAADLLGLNRNTLRKKIRDLDIQVYRSGGLASCSRHSGRVEGADPESRGSCPCEGPFVMTAVKVTRAACAHSAKSRLAPRKCRNSATM